MTTVLRHTIPSAALRARALAFALTARSLAEDPAALLDPAHRDALRAALADAQLADDRAELAALDAFDPWSLPDAEALRGTWVRWFDLGRVAPYEGSNVPATAGGITPRLADVAGFYRTLGMTVSGDRPDHAVAELEFVALALLHEADALDAADHDRLDVITDIARSFLRDHVGTWLDAWAARVGGVPELAPWAPFAQVAVRLLRAEAARHNVVPTRSNAIVAGDIGVPDDGEAELECGDDAGWD